MAAKVLVKGDSHDGLRDKLQTAVTAKHGAAPGSNDYYGSVAYGSVAYVQDVFPGKVVHSKSGKDNRGKLFSSPYKLGDKGDVKLGEPTEVERAYKPLAESERGMVEEAMSFTEAAMTSPTAKTRELTVTIIKPGFNTSKTRFYSPKALRETGHVFTGAKVFINHATKAEEAARPEGSVRDWAGSLTGVPWVESDGSLKSKAIIHQEATVKMLDGLKEANLLPQLGMSIRAAGVQTPATVQGTKTLMVEAFAVCKSVDMVTFPGAGGGVDSMAESSGLHHLFTAPQLYATFTESDTTDIDLMPLSVLKESRPDLVAQITQEVQESYNMAKTVEELEAELKESNRLRDEATTKLALVESTGKKAAVQAELTTKLKEAGLPKAAEDKLVKQFAEATEVAGIAEAIAAEKAYLKEAGVVTKPGVRGMGAVHDITESAALRTNYVAAQTKAGFTKEMAEASADSLGL